MASARQATPLPPGIRILLIDDEPSVLRAYQRTFSRYDVHTALGGREGLEKLRQDHNFDVILCDLMMPDFDGPMLLEAVTREAPELVDRLLFCSGGAFTDRARHFLAQFPRGCLQKPLERAAFEAAVKQVLSQ